MSKKLAVVFAILTMISVTGLIHAQVNMNNFCMQPAFASRVLKPNVMVLMDTSGSMRFRADVNAFNSANTYYGYFDPTQWYTYNTGVAPNRFETVGDKASLSKQLQYWDGNFLNWAATRRMDAVKKVLVGGKVVDRTGPNYELVGEFQDCPVNPEKCLIPVQAAGAPGDLPIANGGSFADQRVTETTTAASITKLSTSNNTTSNNFNCAFATSTANAATGTISWTLTTNNAVREPITTCAQIVLRAPTAATTTLKAFDQVDPGSANILGFYNTNGPGTYQIQFTERSSASCSSGSGSPTPSLTLNNISMTVIGNFATTASMTFSLAPGASNGQSSLEIVRSCGSTGYNVRVLTTTEPTGVIQATDPDIRFGLEFYETVFSGTNGGRVIQSVRDDLATTGLNCLNSDGSALSTGGFISCIEKLPPNSGTPLGESIWSAIGYFANTSGTDSSGGPRYATSSYPVNCERDAFNFAGNGGAGTTCSNAIMVPCVQSYILAVTDGEPTSDTSFSSTINNISATYASTTGGSEPCPITVGPPARSTCGIDNVTLYGRTDITNLKDRDLRGALTGDQFVSTYLVLAAFGASGGAVLDVAGRNGGFDDSNGNAVPDLTSEYDSNPADGVADNYFNAQNGAQLEAALIAALNDILKRAGSATANSVIGAGKGQGANIMQAFFFPRQNIGSNDLTWVGLLSNLWFQVDPLLGFANIREDSCSGANCTGDDVLHTINDKIATFVFDSTLGETQVRRFTDSDGNGLLNGSDATAIVPDIDLLELKPIWDAGLDLFNRTPASRNIKTTVNGTSLIDFCGAASGGSCTNNLSSFFGGSVNLLQATNAANAEDIINYVRGTDIANTRTRTTTINIGGTNTTNTWKLGDIIDSTAQLQGPIALNDYHRPEVYGDSTYRQFVNTQDYLDRAMAYAGGNDGMFHAFFMGNLGVVNDPIGRPNEVAEITDANSLGKGKEQWAYVPRNALPYLRYLMDKNYCHLYYVNNPPFLFDASISDPSVLVGTYADVVKDTQVDPNDNSLISSTWRTIVIGSMGLGGGCGCTAANCVQSPYNGNTPQEGLSSVFALDVTDPLNPILLWEFTNTNLGFTTAKPAIVKISARTGGNPDKAKSGHWFVVIGSGPTGDVETISHQFRGRSAQALRYFVLNLKDGSLVRTITTSSQVSTNAFSGSLFGVVDSDRDYQDEIAYGGFARESAAGSGNWNQGGVLRIVTHEDPDPANWTISTFINDVGPVPTQITSLLSTIGPTKDLYLYFGTGRYYFKDSSGNIDDSDTQRRLFGIKEPCFDNTTGKIDPTCTTTVAFNTLVDATTNAVSVDTTLATYKGFRIDLDIPPNAAAVDKAERVITDPDVSTLGVVFFTTFKPSSDPCTFGGKTFIYALRYDTGGSGAGFLYGFALIQTSTGSIEQKSLNSAFTDKIATNEAAAGFGRRTAAFLGQPPREGALTVLTPPPFKTVLRIKEQ